VGEADDFHAFAQERLAALGDAPSPFRAGMRIGYNEALRPRNLEAEPALDIQAGRSLGAAVAEAARLQATPDGHRYWTALGRIYSSCDCAAWCLAHGGPEWRVVSWVLAQQVLNGVADPVKLRASAAFYQRAARRSGEKWLDYL
jgi:hypothetical protein